MANPPITLNAWASSPTVLSRGVSPDATLREGLGCIFERQLATIAGHCAATATAADVLLVHDFRRDITRLRAALRLFADAFTPADRKWIDDELLALARSLGEARDLDILRRRMSRQHSTGRLMSGKEALRFAVATAAREVAANKARSYARGARATCVVQGLHGWLSDQRSLKDWREAAAPFAIQAPRLLRRLCDGLPHRDTRVDKLGVTARHRLRKQLKVLRYGLEMVTSPAGDADPGCDPRLLAVLDILGDLNDAEVCHRLWKRLFGVLHLTGRGPPGPPEDDKPLLKDLRGAWRDFRSSSLAVMT